MALLALSFLGGVLTILSPCVLPLLPVIIGGSLTGASKWRPVIITASLSVSVVLFTLALKLSTALIAVPPQVWTYISGGLVIALGVVTIFPHLWEKLSVALKLQDQSNKALQASAQKQSWFAPVLIGFSLGPVFSSCSPTYALILATVLPQTFFVGLINLIAYALGLAVVLLLIAVFGQSLIKKLRVAADPNGWFKRGLGVLFVLVGLLIVTGVMKDIETYFVERGFGITALEEALVEDAVIDMDDALIDEQSESMQEEDDKNILNVDDPVQAPELTGVDTWFNSDPLTLDDLQGKVVLIDFWTYSCINCIRTLPYLNEWHERYSDDGLVIIGVHAPEFAFEKVPENVEDAIAEYDIKYPVVLDNDFATWRAYSNRYWPAKYFIDATGDIRHYHFGEGEYEESEEVIRYLLAEANGEIAEADIELAELGLQDDAPISRAQTAETYLGYARMEAVDTNPAITEDEAVRYSAAEDLANDHWTLEGNWRVEDERSVAMETGAELTLRFSGKDVYLVLSPADTDGTVRVELNGELISDELSGEDVINGVAAVDENRLYHLVSFTELQSDQLLTIELSEGVSAYAFTFGS